MVRYSASGGSTPTLSVITPSFNSSSFLSHTLESVAALSTAHEHLVIDGGSSDDTVELLEHRHDPDLAWMSEPDRGQTHAVNKGLGRARGSSCPGSTPTTSTFPRMSMRPLACCARIRASMRSSATWTSSTRTARQRALPMWTVQLASLSVLRRVHPDPDDHLSSFNPERGAAARRELRRCCRLRLLPTLASRALLRNVNQPLVRFRYHSTSKTASNPALQVEEAHRIRLRYARGAGERWLMAAAFRVMRARGALASPWPDL